MRHYHHSKSGLFLMELLINLLLFCVLCGFGLLFFIKANKLTDDTVTLQYATRIVSDVASIYESSDGSFDTICEIFPYADSFGDKLYIYFDNTYNPCTKADAICYVIAEKTGAAPNKVNINFYDNSDTLCYTIQTCNHTPAVLNTKKEVETP
ncbi:MAG: hypothetical protein IIX45_07130 [Lachnospiraceae bacterium]|nr:hypothetical protein [Lachnospiraceae bacterium]